MLRTLFLQNKKQLFMRALKIATLTDITKFVNYIHLWGEFISDLDTDHAWRFYISYVLSNFPHLINHAMFVDSALLKKYGKELHREVFHNMVNELIQEVELN